MIVYALNTCTTPIDGREGIVTLYCVGEQDSLPAVYNNGSIVTSYFADKGEAMDAYNKTKAALGNRYNYANEI